MNSNQMESVRKDSIPCMFRIQLQLNRYVNIYNIRKQLVKKETNKVANKGKLFLRLIRIANFRQIAQFPSTEIALF